MERYDFNVGDLKAIITDTENNGTLEIVYKPLSLPTKDYPYPLYCVINDIREDIRHGRLSLSLTGVNTIVLQKKMKLEGGVKLISSHLFDPSIKNSQIRSSIIKARSTIEFSSLTNIGWTYWGELKFSFCEFNGNPQGLSKSIPQHYKHNNLI